ncbi:MAG: peptidoglycan D,D-transpeptidase FtsI family protein [Nocardioidaceae bacterium]
MVAFVVSMFGARLVQLQGIDENDYAAMAVERGAQTVAIDAPRASIYDRNGVALAQSVDSAKLTADPTYTARDATRIATVLHARIGVDYIATVDLLRKKDTRYVEIARHLEPALASHLVSRLTAAGISGVYTDDDTTRIYPAGDVAANVLGFVGTDDTGLEGLESVFDSTLAGTDGSATFEVSADGLQLPLADKTVTAPQEGTGLTLTIDQDLQFLAQQRLAEAVAGVHATSGSAVIMDVKTGQILALADYPTFDPNQWQSAPDALGAPSLQDPYEPGSVEKPLTFAALIDAHKVTPRTHINVPPTLPSSDAVIHDWNDGHGWLRLTATGAVAQSSNIATAKAAREMQPDRLRGYLTKFGLGTPTHTGLGQESGGDLPASQDWLQVTRDNIAFGQGLSVTAVQMTAALAAIANAGVYVEPSLISGYVDSAGDTTPTDVPDRHRVVSARAAHAVARMMEAVLGKDGLAPDENIPGYRVAGKTGTAQAVAESCGCYRDTVVSFGGFAPADAPRFVVYVVVNRPKDGASGGGTAGPVFKDLMVAALQKFGVPPTGEEAPALPVYW